jgi:hypothetical protein
MKKQMTKLLFALSALTLIGLSSCREDVLITNSYQEAPVIYCLLDQSEDIHFVKINRGFIGPGNAFEFAKIPDSNYFENVSAKIEELVNNVAVRTWQLQDTLLATKDTDGAFFGPEQKVYYFDNGSQKLRTDATYRLSVDINEGKVKVVGETKIISGFASTHSLSAQNAQLKLVKEPAEYQSVNIFCEAGTAVFGSVKLYIDIAEIRGTDTTIITAPWKIGEGPASIGKINQTGQGETFYNQIKSVLTNDNTITRRNFLGFTVEYIGGANEFYNYLLVNKPSSTLTQTKPTYTNLSVTSGYKVVGLFSARETFRVYKPFVANASLAYLRSLDQNSTRELCQGEILGTYLFCSQHPGDTGGANPKDYACQ